MGKTFQKSKIREIYWINFHEAAKKTFANEGIFRNTLEHLYENKGIFYVNNLQFYKM